MSFFFLFPYVWKTLQIQGVRHSRGGQHSQHLNYYCFLGGNNTAVSKTCSLSNLLEVWQFSVCQTSSSCSHPHSSQPSSNPRIGKKKWWKSYRQIRTAHSPASSASSDYSHSKVANWMNWPVKLGFQKAFSSSGSWGWQKNHSQLL